MADQIKFGTDGWRGVVADDFSFANVRRVAPGVAEYMRSLSRAPLAVVGYDCRFASEDFARTVADVLAANGVRTLMFDRPSPTQVASWTVIDRQGTGAAWVGARARHRRQGGGGGGGAGEPQPLSVQWHQVQVRDRKRGVQRRHRPARAAHQRARNGASAG